MDSVFLLKEQFEKSWTKKDGCRRRDINNGINEKSFVTNEKKKKSLTANTVVRQIFLLYHSLPLVVTRFHLLSLDVPLFCLCINDPFSIVLSSSTLPNFACSFILYVLTSRVADVSAVFR